MKKLIKIGVIAVGALPFLAAARLFFQQVPNHDAVDIIRAALHGPLGSPPIFPGWPGATQHFLTILSSYLALLWQAFVSVLGGSQSFIEAFSFALSKAYVSPQTIYYQTGIWYLALFPLTAFWLWRALGKLAVSFHLKVLGVFLFSFQMVNVKVFAYNVRPDAIMLMSLMAMLYFLLSYAETKKFSALFGLSLFSALAITSKISALGFFGATVIFMGVSSKAKAKPFNVRGVGYFILLTAAFVLLLCPYYLTQPFYMLKGFKNLIAVFTGQLGGTRVISENAWWHFIKLFWVEVGGIVLVQLLVLKKGFASGFSQHISFFLLGYVAFFLSLVGISAYHETHYFMPASLFLPLILVIGLAELNKTFQNGVILGVSLTLMASFLWQVKPALTQRETGEMRCQLWAEENLQHDAVIMYDYGTLSFKQGKRFYENMLAEARFRIAQPMSHYFGTTLLHDVVVAEERTDFFEAQLVLANASYAENGVAAYKLSKPFSNPALVNTIVPEYLFLSAPWEGTSVEHKLKQMQVRVPNNFFQRVKILKQFTPPAGRPCYIYKME